ncbi:hypothetical protein MBM_01901 [Drepanopeziza brunnea f. sp. 'multigermtubi' MB_m1]|uniref:Uncharacterized protein n=1 Tax=Marssonina brunnea f. sp. multigermtubi (strain MB_m1) TaxID=1072389 RepID=K1Y438_MARBU|nr:uncharacterized protein MBM_01901 [Drepanopeziza brunnea f. sp. 'multigermtubi' MB_m1]EKD19949.1 hypothetical protein MBM_01901 [Drepanopeziza brunnea f. sp. 'multigermtubi' MB_m1]
MANTSVLQNQLSDADTFPMGNRCPGNGVYHSICYQIETEKSVICALAGLDGDHKYITRRAAELTDLRAYNTKSSELSLAGQLASYRYIEIALWIGRWSIRDRGGIQSLTLCPSWNPCGGETTNWMGFQSKYKKRSGRDFSDCQQRPVSHRDMMIDPVLQALSLPLADQQFQSLPDVAATECVINKVNSLATAEDTEDTQMAGTGEEVEEEDEDEENYYLFVPPRHPRMR